MILNKNAQTPQSKKISAVRYKKGAYKKERSDLGGSAGHWQNEGVHSGESAKSVYGNVF
jgi:hypothetical protein